MRKQFLYISLCLGFMLSSFASGQEKVKLSDPQSFSMILLPDPQTYNKFDYNQGIFDLMLGWVSHHVDSLSIKAVLCTGDLVEQNNRLVPIGANGNQTSTQMWKNISHAFERLDQKVPYMISTGNHDYGYESGENRQSQFPDYFPAERNSCWRTSLVSVCNNAFGLPTLENAAYEIQSESWGKLLIICAEFAPRDEVLTWAKELCSKPAYKNHKVIFLTHSYMKCDGSVIEKESYKVTPANYGKAIWEKFIFPCENVKMVVCGHSAAIAGYDKNVSYRVDKNAAGKAVAQMMFNAQTAGGGWHGNGGEGWLRILEFMPDGKSLKVRTFSPLFAVSPTTQQYAWRNESFDNFTITIE